MKKKGHRHTKAGKSTITRRPSQWPRTLRRTTWLARHPAPQNTTSCFVEHTEDWRPCWLSSGVFLSPEEESELLLPLKKWQIKSEIVTRLSRCTDRIRLSHDRVSNLSRMKEMPFHWQANTRLEFTQSSHAKMESKLEQRCANSGP
jgi:hypothetical protein